MTKIKKLTNCQEQDMLIYREIWLDQGRSTAPLDLLRVQDSVNDLYSLIDLEAPALVHCQSPWQMAYMVASFKKIGKFEGNNLRNNLWNNLGNNLRNNLGNNLRNNLWNNLGNNLGNNLRNNLRNNLWNNLGNNLRNNLGNNLRNNLWNNLRDNELDKEFAQFAKDSHNYWTFYSQWYLYWLSFYDFPRSIGIKYTEEENKQLDIWLEVSRSVFGCATYEGICFVCERPTTLTVDAQGRLHNELGPALAFSDGYELYYWHGIQLLPEDYSKPLEVKRIDNESNVEVRRALIEKYGQAKYLLDSGAEKLHEDDFGVLYRKQLTGDESIFMVKVVNSSPEPDGSFKDYFLGIDPKAYRDASKITAKAAVASTWRYEGNTEYVFPNPEDYIPLVET
jgi:hypothetical protein